MGMAASQARLLAITARIHDVEYQAQSIQNAKIQLATQQDDVYQEYLAALDATTMTYRTANGCVPATFNNLCGYENITNNSVALRDSKGRLIVDDELYEGYKNFNSSNYEDSPYMFALFMMDGYNYYISEGGDLAYNDYHEAEETAYTKLTANGQNEKLENARTALEEFIKANLGEDWDKNIYSHDILDKLETTELKNEYKDLLSKYQYQLYTASSYIPAEDKELEPQSNDKESYCGAALIYQLVEKYDKFDLSDFDEDKYNYYISKYQQIKQCGGCISINDKSFQGVIGNGDAANDSEWLQEMVQNGQITIETVSMSKGEVTMSGASPSSDSKISYTPTTDIDSRALKKAEAKYESELKKIDKKDKAFDMTLSKLETQRNALTTEYDSVKKVISDNIERTFGIFS